MSTDNLKEMAFRYCDKVALAIVVLFVAWKVFLAAPEDGITTGGGGDGGKLDVAAKADDFVKEVVPPWTKIDEPAKPPYDPFYAQRVIYLNSVQLQMAPKTDGTPTPPAETDKDTTKDVRELPAKLVGDLKPWTPPDAFLNQIDLYRARLKLLNPQMPPCQVKLTVDPATRKTLTFEAVADGDWIVFEGSLDNENKIRVAVKVDPAGAVKPIVVLAAVEVQVQEEQLGNVVVRFLSGVPPRTANDKTEYVAAAYYTVYRKAEGEAEMRQIGQVKGTGKAVRIGPAMAPGERMRPPAGMEEEMMMPPVRPDRRRNPRVPPGMPGGMTPEEMMEGGMPPVMPRGRGGIPAERMREYGLTPDRRPEPEFAPERSIRQGEFVFVDSGVESEAKYTYWVEAVAIIEETGKTLSMWASSLGEKPGSGFAITTAEKFSISYIGHRVRDGAMVANIIVFIGPRDRPLEWRRFEVYPGAWIGDAPGVKATEEETKPVGAPVAGAGAPVVAAPDVAPGAMAPAAADDEAGQNYVTRFVLVDILPTALRLLVDEVPAAIDGRMVRVNSYKYVPKPKIIIRDRKNRLIELWHEPAPKLDTPTKGPTDPRGRGDRVPPRRVPPAMGEGMTPEEMMEQGMVPPPSRLRPPRRR